MDGRLVGRWVGGWVVGWDDACMDSGLVVCVFMGRSVEELIVSGWLDGWMVGGLMDS